jgi:hypothetical protein
MFDEERVKRVCPLEDYKLRSLAGRGLRLLSERAVGPRYSLLSALGRNVPR